MSTNNAKLKGIWNIREVNAYIAEWKISSFPPPPLHVSKRSAASGQKYSVV